MPVPPDPDAPPAPLPVPQVVVAALALALAAGRNPALAQAEATARLLVLCPALPAALARGIVAEIAEGLRAPPPPKPPLRMLEALGRPAMPLRQVPSAENR